MQLFVRIRRQPADRWKSVICTPQRVNCVHICMRMLTTIWLYFPECQLCSYLYENVDHHLFVLPRVPTVFTSVWDCWSASVWLYSPECCVQSVWECWHHLFDCTPQNANCIHICVRMFTTISLIVHPRVPTVFTSVWDCLSASFWLHSPGLLTFFSLGYVSYSSYFSFCDISKHLFICICDRNSAAEPSTTEVFCLSIGIP